MQSRADVPRAAPTGSRSPRTSTCSRPPGGCPTCTTSASTGSTSRRCWRPSRAASTGTTSSPTTASTSPAAAPTGWPRCPPRRAASGMGVLVDIVPNHVGVATPDAGHVVVGRAAPGRSRARATFDIDWAAGGGRSCRARRRCDSVDRGARRLRYYDHAPVAPARHVERAALPARRWRAGTRAQLPALLHHQLAGRRSGSRTGGLRRHRTSRSGAGSTRASSTGCGSTTPTACATRRLPRRPGGADRRRLRAGREDPGARRGAAAVVGDARAPPATTRSR